MYSRCRARVSADVGQPPLLRELVGVGEGPHVRERAVLEAGEEHDGELQALGGVQGHEGDDALVDLGRAVGVVRAGDLVGVRDERDALEEVGEVRLGVALLELGRDGVQLGEVLHPGRVLRVLARPELGQVAAAVEHRPEDLGRSAALLGEVAQVGHHLGERAQPGRRPRGQPGHLVDPVERRPERDPLAVRERRDHRLRPLPEPALGDVEDAPQVDVVVGVVDRPQVGDGVLDLAALVEPRPADHLVRQADADEHLLQRPGLRVGPVEDRDVAGAHAVGVGQPVDLLGDEPRLLVLVVRDVADDLGARRRSRSTAASAADRGCGR